MNGDSSIYSAAQLGTALREDMADVEVDGHPHAGLVEDDEVRKLLSVLRTTYSGNREDLPDDLAETDTYQAVLENTSTEMLQTAVKTGNVAQMQNAVGLVNNQTEDENGNVKAELAQRLTLKGQIVVVTGSPGTGKTALMMDVVALAARMMNGVILGNVPKWEGQDVMIDNSEDLLDEMGSVDKPTFGALDEVGSYIKSSNPKAAERWADDLRGIRNKMAGDTYPKRGRIVMVGHTERGVGKDIRRMASEIWHKPSRADKGRVVVKEISEDGDTIVNETEYVGLSDTPDSYAEHRGATFRVPTEDDGETEEDSVDTERQEAIKTSLRAVARGDTYREAAELVDYGRNWVGNRVREYKKKGEYVDLVDVDLEDEADD